LAPSQYKLSCNTDGFTDQLALTGKFDTGAFKHRFNTGVEYSDQKTDRTQYILNGLDSTGSANNTCNCCNCFWLVHSVQNPSNVPWTGSISTDGADRYNIRSKNQSVYFLDNIELSPQWLLDLGVRWDKFETKQTMTYGESGSGAKIHQSW
jgi:catecholate siderophore receptor